MNCIQYCNSIEFLSYIQVGWTFRIMRDLPACRVVAAIRGVDQRMCISKVVAILGLGVAWRKIRMRTIPHRDRLLGTAVARPWENYAHGRIRRVTTTTTSIEMMSSLALTTPVPSGFDCCDCAERPAERIDPGATFCDERSIFSVRDAWELCPCFGLDTSSLVSVFGAERISLR